MRFSKGQLRIFLCLIICFASLFVILLFSPMFREDTPIQYKEVAAEGNDNDDDGGGDRRRPARLTLLVPFRDRFDELVTFIPYMHDYLTAQGIPFRIFILNQVDTYRFNRAALVNVGFKESSSGTVVFTDPKRADLSPVEVETGPGGGGAHLGGAGKRLNDEEDGEQYICMHDVDLLPKNPHLPYGIPPSDGVMHISSPQLHPKYHYKRFLGGILSIRRKHFIKVNGLSNTFWGWGMEDDEFNMRLSEAKIKVYNPKVKTNSKTTFHHDHNAEKRPRDYKRGKNQPKNDTLMRMIRMLAVGADDVKRQKEKSSLEKKFHESDLRLNTLVKENLNDLTTVMVTFGSILQRVSDSQERIFVLKENLISCKNLLNCKRVEIRKLWLDGIKSRTIVDMLDKIEKVKDVNVKYEHYVVNKKYLHASQLLCTTSSLLENELKYVGSLSNLKDEMFSKKEELANILLNELQTQIYFKCTSIVIQGFKRQGSQRRSGTQSNNMQSIRSLTETEKQNSDNLSRLNNVSLLKLSRKRVIVEDLDAKDPEIDIIRFVSVLVSALDTLDKLPEAISNAHNQIEAGLRTLVKKTSQQLTENCSEEDDLANQNSPQSLLEMLTILFDQIKIVTKIHQVLLANIDRINTSRESENQLETYNLAIVWQAVQIVVEETLRHYLNVQNNIIDFSENDDLQASEDNGDFSQFFKRKVKPVTDKVVLFSFGATGQNYSKSQYGAELGELSDQSLVCKPLETNITTIYQLVKVFIADIEKATDGPCSLNTFIDDFVSMNYIKKTQIDMSNAVKKQTQDEDRQFYIVDLRTQQELGIDRPVLQATVCVVRAIQELVTMIDSMKEHAESFLSIAINILREYYNHCYAIYKSIIIDGEHTKTISGVWAIDDDINRFLRMMPNWRDLKEERDQSDMSEEDLRAMNNKESCILTDNLTADCVASDEIVGDIKLILRLSYLCESTDWLTKKLALIEQQLKIKSNNFTISTKVLGKFADLINDLQTYSELCLTVLHLEVRVHCFYYLIPLAKQKTNYSNAIDDMDPDNYVIKLNKDLNLISDELRQCLRIHRFNYVFEGLGHLCSTIFLSCTQILKRINENGIKKMCRNITSVQQKLTEISLGREAGLDHARQYFELLYKNTDDILKTIITHGPQYTEQEYLNLLNLAYHSEKGISITLTGESSGEAVLRTRLTDILKEYKSLV